MSDLLLFAQEAVPVEPEFSILHLLNRLEPSHAFVLAIVAMGCMTAIVIVLLTSFTTLIKSWRLAKIRGQLVQDMLDRGLSPGEIQELVQLTNSDSFGNCGTRRKARSEGNLDLPPAKPIHQKPMPVS